MKFNSIDGSNIYIREFIHMGLSNGVDCIYLSNPYNYDLEVKVFFAGDDETSQFTPDGVYQKYESNSIVTINHNSGYRPLIFCVNSNGEPFVHFSITSIDNYNVTLNFTQNFFGKIMVRKLFSDTQTEESDTWTITHNLNKYPGYILVGDSLNSEFDYPSYPDANTVILHFNSPVTGNVKLY